MDKGEVPEGDCGAENHGIMTIMLSFFACIAQQKLNTCIAASSDHFVINRMSKFASVLYNPLVYSE